MTPAVALQQLRKTYGPLTALDGLDLTVQPGEVLGLLGHNGAGKTTAMKLILGLIRPDGGQVRVFGESPTGPAAHRLRRRLGYLPENVSFYDQLTGREVLRFFARLKNVPAKHLDTLLEQVGLAEAAGRRVAGYSKGMRQRLGLAQALLGEPRLLLLDEPTVGLDPRATGDFYAGLDELRGRGVSVILSSHVLPGVERHIDRAAILGRGRLLALGSLAALRERADLPVRLRLRGDLARLQEPGLTLTGPNRGDLAVSPLNKLNTLRRLLACPEVHDVEVDSPSLEALYTHYSGRDAP